MVSSGPVAPRAGLEDTVLTYGLRFIWASAKNESNQRIHEISFKTAKEVFGDSHQVVFENYFIEDQGEQRQTILGMTERLALIMGILVDHDSAAGDTIHLISARKADKYEQTIYSSSFQS